MSRGRGSRGAEEQGSKGEARTDLLPCSIAPLHPCHSAFRLSKGNQ